MAASDTSPAAAGSPGAVEEAPQPLTLDVSIDTISACERRVRVGIPREDIDRYRDMALGELVPGAQ